MPTTEGRLMPSISDATTQVVAELRQALRPIEAPYGESSGGPDGWSPEPDEIREWEETFREHATPANVSLLLDALPVWRPIAQHPRLYEQALVQTTDADGEPVIVIAHWNGASSGFLGVGGHRIKPATHWMPLPPIATTKGQA